MKHIFPIHTLSRFKGMYLDTASSPAFHLFHGQFIDDAFNDIRAE